MNVYDWIKKNEGFRSKPYRDTLGNMTVGFGRNLDSVGISPGEAEFMFHNDIYRCIKELTKHNFYQSQNTNAQAALLDMCYNLGISGLLKFKRMIAALEKKDIELATKEALDSNWANQVPNRAIGVCNMMLGKIDLS